MKILHLTLKKQWFDMIASGEKREEYRELKDYWERRLERKRFDAVLFRNGYQKNSPKLLVELKDIAVKRGLQKWGAPTDRDVYVLKLGEVIEQIQGPK